MVFNDIAAKSFTFVRGSEVSPMSLIWQITLLIVAGLVLAPPVLLTYPDK